MGINLPDIVLLESRKLEDFSGKVLAIDAFNTLYSSSRSSVSQTAHPAWTAKDA